MNLEINPEDDKEIRALKYLLAYGGHKEGCDRSNEKTTDPNVQHECCSCGWCQVTDWAHMWLLLTPEEK